MRLQANSDAAPPRPSPKEHHPATSNCDCVGEWVNHFPIEQMAKHSLGVSATLHPRFCIFNPFEVC